MRQEVQLSWDKDIIVFSGDVPSAARLIESPRVELIAIIQCQGVAFASGNVGQTDTASFGLRVARGKADQDRGRSESTSWDVTNAWRRTKSRESEHTAETHRDAK